MCGEVVLRNETLIFSSRVHGLSSVWGPKCGTVWMTWIPGGLTFSLQKPVGDHDGLA